MKLYFFSQTKVRRTSRALKKSADEAERI
jgi:hypothetical protein